MKDLVLHSLKKHHVQTISIVVCVALSVAVCLSAVLVYGGAQRGIEISNERMGSDVIVLPEGAEKYIASTELLYTGAPAPVYMDESAVDTVLAIDGVEAASPQFYSQTLNESCCSSAEETRLIGVDFDTDFVVTPLVGAQGTLSLADDEIIVGCEVSGINDGAMTIYGDTYRVYATMAATGTDFDYSVVMNIDHAREISRTTAGLESYWDKYGDPANLVSVVMVDLTQDETAYNVALNRLKLTDGITFYENSDIADAAFDQLSAVFALLLAMACVMVAITLLQLFARFYTCVWDRKSELALYRAIGASKANLRAMICAEIGALVAVGFVVGLVLGFELSAILVGRLLDQVAFPFVSLGAGAQVAACALIALALVVVSAAAVVWPLRQIGKLEPSLAMQQGDID
jgi:putative ABC transport system permease protein